MEKQNKQAIIIGFILALAIAGFYIYRILLPSDPILDNVPNHISDKATLSKNLNEEIPASTLKNVYFGDLHVHTKLSLDAYIGGTIATPSQAYLFAKGETIEILDQKVKLSRPLDFAAVTDHAESIGEMYTVQTSGVPGHQALVARYLRSIPGNDEKAREVFTRSREAGVGLGKSHRKFFQGFETVKSAWQIHLDAAEQHYAPGIFTTLAGYEWSLGRDFAHFHRNVIFRDMKVPDYPLSAIELKTPESLWAYLEKITNDGATVLAIPHNSNMGKGSVFINDETDIGQLNKTDLELQNSFEPLLEIHQAKGNSEVHARFWPNDEFADFENYDYEFPYKNNYARYALKKGLEVKAKTGINPYQFGIMASTDTHNGTPGNTEEAGDFIGNHAMLDVNAQRRREEQWVLNGSVKGTDLQVFQAINPGGLVAVWAEANTRSHIWDALKRKETYGTSGGRIQLRFFGGFDFEKKYDTYEEMVKAGYQKGIPMGGVLRSTNFNNKAPSFIVWAAKDPESANLDRIQMIKGWYNNGKTEERIYNVVFSDNRFVNTDGSVPDNGATVDFKTGAWSKGKGAVELQTVWTDLDFDSSVSAFYYVRVLELPTARYTLWDQIRYGIEFPEDTKMTVRERAWSSPIWYEY